MHTLPFLTLLALTGGAYAEVLTDSSSAERLVGEAQNFAALGRLGFGDPASMIARYPELATLDLELNLAPTLAEFRGGWAIPAEVIERDPRLLGGSLARVAELRAYLAARGIDPREMPLSTRLRCLKRLRAETVDANLRSAGLSSIEAQTEVLKDPQWQMILIGFLGERETYREIMAAHGVAFADHLWIKAVADLRAIGIRDVETILREVNLFGRADVRAARRKIADFKYKNPLHMLKRVPRLFLLDHDEIAALREGLRGLGFTRPGWATEAYPPLLVASLRVVRAKIAQLERFGFENAVRVLQENPRFVDEDLPRLMGSRLNGLRWAGFTDPDAVAKSVPDLVLLESENFIRMKIEGYRRLGVRDPVRLIQDFPSTLRYDLKEIASLFAKLAAAGFKDPAGTFERDPSVADPKVTSAMTHPKAGDCAERLGGFRRREIGPLSRDTLRRMSGR